MPILGECFHNCTIGVIWGLFRVTENRILSIVNKTSNQMDRYEASNWDRDRNLHTKFPVGCAIVEMEYSQRKTPRTCTKTTDAEDYSVISHHLVLGSVDPLGESTLLEVDGKYLS
jgi:hypothetical protein